MSKREDLHIECDGCGRSGVIAPADLDQLRADLGEIRGKAVLWCGSRNCKTQRLHSVSAHKKSSHGRHR